MRFKTEFEIKGLLGKMVQFGGPLIDLIKKIMLLRWLNMKEK